MAQFRVRKRNGLFDVLTPDGRVKCSVEDGALAYQIANDLIRECSKEPTPVRCVETGKVYADHYEAAKDKGVYAIGIKKCCTGVVSKSGGYTWEFAYADET